MGGKITPEKLEQEFAVVDFLQQGMHRRAIAKKLGMTKGEIDTIVKRIRRSEHYSNLPTRNEIASRAMIEIWKDPEYRDRASLSMRITGQKPEVREKRRIIGKIGGEASARVRKS